ncbi:hypothetical protein [Oligoflexus tunisiensis]|uniref:hypothetical protein n=1 Tax=Oligoflexus tunisiensis TaxID=708132 RepID=UPI00114CBCF8|nr:hypothetical protein [Oligoflexus tunisiensis]
MIRMICLVLSICIAGIGALSPVANAQGPLRIPKIDPESLKGLDFGSAPKEPQLEMPSWQPREDKFSLNLTPEEAEFLKKALKEKEQTPYELPEVKNTHFNPHLDIDDEAAKALLDRFPKKETEPSLVTDASSVGAFGKNTGELSPAEQDAHEELLKDNFGSPTTIWTQLTNDIFKGEPENVVERNRVKRLLFADYLGYLNAVGLELASYEITLKAAKEKANGGKCSQTTAEEYEQNLIDSVQADPDTFAKAYCNNICKDQSSFLERAKFAAPEGAIESCADKARKIYDQYNCNEFGQNPRANDSSLYFATTEGTPAGSESLNPNRADSTSAPTGSISSLPKIPGLSSSVSSDPVRGPALNFDANLLASRVDFESSLQKQKANCKRLEYIKTRTIWAAPDGQDRTPFEIPGGRDPLDPRWTTPSDNFEDEPEELSTTTPKNNTCETTEKVGADHFAKLRSEYQRISFRKIAETLGDWPLLDENDNIKKDYLRLILQTSDQLFLKLIDDLEMQHKKVCGSTSSLVADTSMGTTGIGGRNYEVVIKANPDDLNKKDEAENPKEEKPETLAHHFNQTSSITGSLIDSILGTDQIGPATIPEFRGAEIANAVLDGYLHPEDIPTEAARGPTGRLAQEIVKQTEKYLANGEYQGLKLFAAQMAGGVVTGGGTAIKNIAKAGAKAASVGSFSKLLKGAKRIIMKPMLEGGQTGAIRIASSIFVKNGYVQTASAKYPFKFTEYYFKKLSETGRKSPFLTARDVLESGRKMGADRKPGFFRYETEYWEMIYNPATREVWHLQPIR